jgi:hypothetical protein
LDREHPEQAEHRAEQRAHGTGHRTGQQHQAADLAFGPADGRDEPELPLPPAHGDGERRAGEERHLDDSGLDLPDVELPRATRPALEVGLQLVAVGRRLGEQREEAVLDRHVALLVGGGGCGRTPYARGDLPYPVRIPGIP